MRIIKTFLLLFTLVLFICGCSPVAPLENQENNEPQTEENLIINNNAQDDCTSDDGVPGSDLTDEIIHTPDTCIPNDDNLFNEISSRRKPLKGAWVTTVWNMDYPKNATQNSLKLQQEIDVIISKAKDFELTALFFQVRPCADSFYKSDIFPWSKFLSGAQGVAPNNNFDPLHYIINQCHKVGIELHAWINPLRVTVVSSDKLISSHPAILNPELTFKVNEKVFFNPGEPRARDLIIDGVREILNNYDVDGIHYDDYFYPENMKHEDFHTWQEHGSNFESIADFRRNSTDELIRQTFLAVKEIKPAVAFGVSPSGIWANKSSNPLGSDTRGFESYYSIFADSRGWVKKGYVDYIAPQIYWYIGQSGSDFSLVLDWWRNVCKDTNVELITGLAGYKVGTGGAWNIGNQLNNQIQLALENGNGFIVFTLEIFHFLDFHRLHRAFKTTNYKMSTLLDKQTIME